MLTDSTVWPLRPGAAVRRAVVHGARLDAIAARRNTERLLEQAPSVVPGMSASSVLCVRKLSVHVRGQSRHHQPAGNFFGSEMARMARQAARPAHGMVPANAEAVLFMDRAELLECLACDLLRHKLMQGWWWQVLLAGPDLAAAAERLWVKEAAHAPAALARLAHSRDAVAFVRILGEACTSDLIRAVIRAHGLPLLADDTAAAMPPLQTAPPTSAMQPGIDARTLVAEMRAALPEVLAPELSRPQRLLLAVSLSLVRLPQHVRSTAFAEALPVLLEEAGLFHAKPLSVLVRPSSISSGLDIGSPHPNPLPLAGEGTTALSPPGRELERGNGQCDEFLEAPACHSNGKPGTNSLMANLDAARSPSGEPLHSLSSQATGEAANAYDISPFRPAMQSITSTSNTERYQMQTVVTQFGGAFFLVNAALALGLYPDFTRPLDRGLEMPLWDFLALAAADMEGATVKRDPLWLLLAELAGRKPGQRPGTGFMPPREWRLPVAWLDPFAADTGNWVWNTEGPRLIMRHPAGFTALDLLRTKMPVEEQLRMELAPYGAPAANRAAALRRSPTTPLARWRSWVMPYLGRRVARALGDVHWRRACRRLLRLPAQIEWDAERLEAHYSLELLPVAVRMAGLDRNPGWVPAAGRDIRFHFGCDHA